MTKEQFMDQVVISMMGNSNNQMLITDRGSVEYWEFAESVWNTRPKKKKSRLELQKQNYLRRKKKFTGNNSGRFMIKR